MYLPLFSYSLRNGCDKIQPLIIYVYMSHRLIHITPIFHWSFKIKCLKVIVDLEKPLSLDNIFQSGYYSVENNIRVLLLVFCCYIFLNIKTELHLKTCSNFKLMLNIYIQFRILHIIHRRFTAYKWPMEHIRVFGQTKLTYTKCSAKVLQSFILFSFKNIKV